MTRRRPWRALNAVLAATFMVGFLLGVGAVVEPAQARSYMPAYRNVERVAVVCRVQHENVRTATDKTQTLTGEALCSAVADALNAALGAPWRGLVSIASETSPIHMDPSAFLIRVDGAFSSAPTPEDGDTLTLSFTVHRSGPNEPALMPTPPPLVLKWPRGQAATIPAAPLGDYVRRNFAEPLRGANPHKR